MPHTNTIVMARTAIFTLLVISLFSACSRQGAPPQPLPQVSQGLLDLRGYDLAERGPVTLTGQWEFYWMKLLAPADFTTSSRLSPAYREIPRMWDGTVTDGVSISPMGHATYRLHVITDSLEEPLAVTMPTLGSSYALYVDDRKIASAGSVGTTPQSMTAAYRPGVFTFTPPGREFEIVLQISNYQQKWGGPWYAIRFGRAADLLRSWDIDLARDLFIFGAIFIMFMYHVALYILRRKDTSTLFFGLFCLSMTIRGAVQGTVMFTYIFPALALEWLLTIDYLTFYIGIPLFCLFMHSLFGKDFNRRVLIAILGISAAFCAVVLVTPPRVFEYTLEPYQVLSLVMAIYGIYVAVVAVVRRRESAMVMLFGYAIITLPMINDVLYAQSLVSTGYLVSYGLFLFIFLQAYLLARRFSTAFTSVEKLSGELETANTQMADLNRTLEQKVLSRTGELSAAMEKLTTVNDELTVTRDHLWGEMQLAKKIQTILLPERPNIDGFHISTYMAPADEVGGDYYDIINVEGMDWLVIGDVSGHGVPAGLFMMMVQTAIHTALAGTPNLKPNALLSRVNRVITENIRRLGEDKYMTITVIACLKDRSFFYSGLHQDIMIYRAATDSVDDVETRGFWIGIMDDIKSMLHDDEIFLEPGDCMLLYTDGITEAWRDESRRDERDPMEDMFGHDRLKACLARTGRGSTDEIKQAILDAMHGFHADDDITMVILKKI